MATDCLIVGFNDLNFPDYVKMVASMGADSGAYRDLNLAFIDYDNKPLRSMDVLNNFYFEGKSDARGPLHNADFLWPVITYLGTYLSRRGFTFDYVNLPHLEKDRLKEKLVKNDVLSIAITTTLYVSPHPIIEIISFIRRYNSTAKILVGGPFISNQPKLGDFISLHRLFKYLGADIYVISQEGEAALVNVIAALKNKSSLDRVDNIAYRQGDKYVMTATSIESNPLEENMVDYSLFAKEDFGQFVTLRTAKSCPFSCAFCGFPQRAGKYKYLSVELVEKEMDAIRNLDEVTTLTFIDDTFNVPKERFREMLRMMIKNNYGFKWNSFYRSDHGDEQTIELMGQAGCEGVFLGVESGSDEMLARMNKSARRKDYLKSIPLLKAAGISTHANVIVGFPGETYATVRETIDLIEEAKPDFFRAQLWYADPVTPIWNKKDEYGVRGSAFTWSHDTMDSRTACELVEKMFLCVEGSIWLPQNGFEQWSTFYLQRKGMTMEQIKTFLKRFNAAVKQKLIYPEKKQLDPGLLASLESSCKFDRQAKSDMRPVEIFSGYYDAEKFWTEEFGATSQASSLEMLRGAAADDGESRSRIDCAISKSTAQSLALSCQVDVDDVLLAAFSLLLSRVSGAQCNAIIAATSGAGEKGVLPLKLEPRWDLRFRDFAQNAREKKLQAMTHQLYAFHIITNPALMSEHGCAPLVLDVGFLYSIRNQSPGGIKDELKSLPKIADNLALTLEATARADEIRLSFVRHKQWLIEQAIENFGRRLQAFLNEAARDPDALLNEISIERQREVVGAAVETHKSEAFNF